VYRYTDLGDPGGCDPPLCAAEGSIRLSRLPRSDDELPGTAVDVDVTFDSGATLSGWFRPP
jgi:hypothetical protein